MTEAESAGAVLLVDDDETFRKVLSAELERRGHVVRSVGTGEAALRKGVETGVEVILLDLRLPDLDGIEVLRRLQQAEAQAGVVLLTGHGTIDTAIQAVRMGAYDYLEKPCPVEKVVHAIQKTREHKRLVARRSVLEDGFSPPDVRSTVIGKSPAFEKLCQNVERIARADATTLILGETGVGKELVARMLHTQSPRRDAPFVVVDCGGLDEDLLRNELFGHEKGAFTGATRLKHGLLEVASGGTLFLDEIGNMNKETQVHLLRVLETGRFRRVGGTKEISVDLRVISATNRDLRQAVERGRFREDLYFRLATLLVDVPPLRERTEDIPLLIEHYARLVNRRFALACSFGEDAIDVLRRYAWPGNVRELIHVLEQAMVVSDHPVIRPGDLPQHVRRPARPADLGQGEVALSPLHEIQRRHVLSVVEQTGGNRAQAARLLEISERNLYRLLKKYEWKPPGL